MNTRKDQVIALAGISRAAIWTHELASKGHYDPTRMQQAVNSILCTDPSSVADVFGGRVENSIPELEDGLPLLHAQLGGPGGAHTRPEMTLMTRYFGEMLRLAARLQKDDTRLQEIAGSIQRLRHTNAVVGTGPNHAVERLSATYQATISTLKPRIMVQGDQNTLGNEGHANSIRVLLFSGVRSGVLWRQCGGRLWQLFLMRSALLQTAQQL